MKLIEAYEIRKLSGELGRSSDWWRQNTPRTKLDLIADERRAGNYRVTGEDGADSDGALDLLRGHGRFSVADSFGAWSRLPKEETPDYRHGMTMLGLPYEEVKRLAVSLENSEFPLDVIDAVIDQQGIIQSLHPDRYPFEDMAYDIISDGLLEAEINTESIWNLIEEYLLKNSRTDLALMYGYGSPLDAVIGFLAHYALTKHDIAELNRTRREVHF